MCDAALEDDDAGEGEDPSNWWPRAAAIATMATSTPATRVQRIRIRRVVARAGAV
jgi:hypothetical protein